MSDVDPEKLHRELESMREMIESDPDVLAHFDTNGDGRIDGDEWNAVVEMVRGRLHREGQEAARAQAIMARDAANDAEQAEPAPQMHPERADGELAAELFTSEVRPYIQHQNIEIGPKAVDLDSWNILVMILRDYEVDVGPGYKWGYQLVTQTEGRVGWLVSNDEDDFTFDVWQRGEKLPYVVEMSGRRVSAHNQEGVVVAWAKWSTSTFGRDGFVVSWRDKECAAQHDWLDSSAYSVRDGKVEVGTVQHDYIGFGVLFREGYDKLRFELPQSEDIDMRLGFLIAGVLVAEFGTADEDESLAVSALDVLDILLDD